MTTKHKLTIPVAVTILFLLFPAVTLADDYTWTDNLDGTCMITDYTGPGGDITIPDTLGGLTVTSIGQYAFKDCTYLTSVTIGNSVTSIDSRVFRYCSSLTAITVDVSNNAYSSIDGVLFSKDQTVLILCPEGKVGDYTIPSSVTSIGYMAFYNCAGLASIIIPDNVTSIDSYAFSDCTSLTSLTIGSSVTSIGSRAFYDCSALTSTSIPDAVTSIGSYAFGNCSTLTSIYIPANVTSIGEGIFYYCTDMTAITVDALNPAYSSIDGVLFSKDQTVLIQYPASKPGDNYTVLGSVTSIDSFAFYRCSSLTSVSIPDSVTSIGDWAFFVCTSLTSVTIGSNVTSIDSWAFYGCYGLTSISIPDSVTSIGSGAFGNCSNLTSVTIPASLTSIGSSAFGNCSSLTAITVDVSNTAYSSIDGVLFSKDQTVIIQYPQAKAGDNYTVPGSVTSIGSLAFDNCSSLTSVTIPASLTSIVSSAFGNCSSLTAITVDVSNTAYSSIDGVLFSKDQTVIIQYPQAKAGDYTIPGSVTSIGSSAFDGCTYLTSVTIGSSVTSIGDAVFAHCPSLTDIIIPHSVTSIGDAVFYECSSLTSVTIGSGVTSIGIVVFDGCSGLTAIMIDALNPAYSSIDGVLLSKDQTLLIQYPASKAGDYTIPGSVTSIGEAAFTHCTSLTSVTIGNGVTSIGDAAFALCSSLTSVAIGSSVTSIGDQAFASCTSLTSVYCKGDAPSLGSSVFDGVEGIVYYIPSTTGWSATYGGLLTAEWPPSPADVDLNYEVDMYDFSMLAGQWGQAGCQVSNDWCDWADFDQSGTVDPNDLNILADDWLFGIVP